MTQTPPSDEVREEVRRLLESAPAFRALPPERRRMLARDMALLGDSLADPDWLTAPAAPAAAQPLAALRRRIADAPPLAQALRQTTGAGFRGGAAAEGAEVFKELVGSVDFPQFIAGLVSGVFNALIDASIEQMEAYQELLSSVVGSAATLANEVSDEDAAAQVMGRFPTQLIAGVRGGLEVAEDHEDDEELFAQLGVPMGSDLDDPGVQKIVLKKAKMEMARQRQQMLATMVLLGINRIVITRGKINAKVQFSMRSTDSAQERHSASYQRDQSEEKSSEGSGSGGWGSRKSNSKTKRKFQTTVANTSSSGSDAELETKAKLSGEVSLEFKSETFPLERLADSGALSILQDRAQPSSAPRPNDAGGE